MALCGLIGNNAAAACAQSPSKSTSTKINTREYIEELHRSNVGESERHYSIYG